VPRARSCVAGGAALALRPSDGPDAEVVAAAAPGNSSFTVEL
jgi:hypothetical protein